MKNQDLLPMTTAIAAVPFECMGCIHYHGKHEFGVLLVCGHQPDGPSDRGCLHKEIR